MIADKKREKKENRRTKETKKGSQNMIKACIFDLDGTIADTVESIAHAVNRVLEHFGLVPRPVSLQLLRRRRFRSGSGARFKRRRRCRAQLSAGGHPPWPRVVQRGPAVSRKTVSNMRETLTALREEVPIAVCSNKPHEAAIHVVESVYGPGFFNRIQGRPQKSRESRLRSVRSRLQTHSAPDRKSACTLAIPIRICRPETPQACLPLV